LYLHIADGGLTFSMQAWMADAAKTNKAVQVTMVTLIKNCKLYSRLADATWLGSRVGRYVVVGSPSHS
jgi:hypothetical protein